MRYQFEKKQRRSKTFHSEQLIMKKKTKTPTHESDDDLKLKKKKTTSPKRGRVQVGISILLSMSDTQIERTFHGSLIMNLRVQ